MSNWCRVLASIEFQNAMGSRPFTVRMRVGFFVQGVREQIGFQVPSDLIIHEVVARVSSPAQEMCQDPDTFGGVGRYRVWFPAFIAASIAGSAVPRELVVLWAPLRYFGTVTLLMCNSCEFV